MNAERLRGLAETIARGYKDPHILDLVSNLTSAFTSSVQSPTEDTAAAYEAARAAVNDAIEQHQAGHLSAGRLAALESLAATDLFGEGLRARLDEIFAYGVSPASVVQGLKDLHKRMQKFGTTINVLITSLNELGIPADSPPVDTAEVEILIPFQIFGDSLEGLSTETKRLDRALRGIVEAATGSRPDLTIRTVGTGSIDIILSVDPTGAVAILTVVNSLITTINSMLQLRKTRQEVARQKPPQSLLEQFEAWHKEAVQKAIDEIRDQLLEGVTDAPRRNELRSELDTSLHYLADRLDRGVDITVATLEQPSSDDDQSAAASDPRSAAIREIRSAMEHPVRRLKGITEPVLALPPREADLGKSES